MRINCLQNCLSLSLSLSPTSSPSLFTQHGVGSPPHLHVPDLFRTARPRVVRAESVYVWARVEQNVSSALVAAVHEMPALWR